MFVGYTVMCVR